MFDKYHKINSLYKRDEKGQFITGEWSQDEFKYLYDNTWVWTEKVDGTNIRVAYHGDLLDARQRIVTFGGRTDNAQIPPMLVTELERLFVVPDLSYPGNAWYDTFETNDVVLYGEGYGARIQRGGGNYTPDGVSFVLFDVTVNGRFLDRENVEDVGDKLGIKVVPVVSSGPLGEAEDFVCEGFNSQWGDFPAEGIVARPLVELQTRFGSRIITKLKTKDYR